MAITYGSDEVGAVVLDISTSSTRAGYAGEDTPKSIIPSNYGYIPAEGELPARYYFGQSGPSTWRPNQQVLNPLQDSIVHDWSAAERLVEHALSGGLRLPNLNENPLLVAEASWNSKGNRERMMEIGFEGWDAPAYYSVDRAVLAAFSTGKGTALVIDVGEETTSVTPVYDGFVLRKGIQKSPLGGALLTTLVGNQLATLAADPSNPFQLRPRYLIKSRKPVSPGHPPQVVLHEARQAQTTESFARQAQSDLIHDFKEAVCINYDQPWNEQAAMSKPPKLFEFPDGFSQNWPARTRQISSEVFFQTSAPNWLPKELLAHQKQSTESTIPTPALSSIVPLQHMIVNSVNACDADLLPSLLGNIVVVGGTTLTPGFVERLHNELTAIVPGFKVGIRASGNVVERKYASWLGGSILSSLGTFHQLWISKAEYLEAGKSIIHRRAK